MVMGLPPIRDKEIDPTSTVAVQHSQQASLDSKHVKPVLDNNHILSQQDGSQQTADLTIASDISFSDTDSA